MCKDVHQKGRNSVKKSATWCPFDRGVVEFGQCPHTRSASPTPINVSFCPDLGLLLFDVASDIMNGVNFIIEGNPTCGWIVIGIICLPVTVYYAFITTSFVIDADDDEPCFDKRERLLIVLLAWLLTPIAIPLFTVALIVYATYSNVGGLVVRLVQGIFEANLQAIFGSSISALRNLLRIKKIFKLNRKMQCCTSSW